MVQAQGAPVNVIEIPDAIPKLYQDQVESELASKRMTWSFQEESARSASMFKNTYPGFSHMAYVVETDESPQVMSPMSSLLLPILFMFCEKAELDYQALLRIRVGLFTRTLIQAKHHNPHVDFSQPHMTAVYYVNDCDGDTVVFKETLNDVPLQMSGRYANDGKFRIASRLSPKKGKMICFDGRHYHASSYPTQANKRIAVTFNFA
jgi:hypothetical protein